MQLWFLELPQISWRLRVVPSLRKTCSHNVISNTRRPVTFTLERGNGMQLLAHQLLQV